MIIHIHSDASYFSKPRARGRAGGHYFLGDKRPDMSKPPTTCPRLNGPIHSISRIMLNLIGSAAEAEESEFLRTHRIKFKFPGTYSTYILEL